MAIFHLQIKIVKRSQGKSAVAAAAYRSGEKLTDEQSKKTHDYTRKKGVVHSEIMLCNNAPKYFKNREKLWNSVQAIEKSKDAQLAREIEMALPRELNLSQQIVLIKRYIRKNFTSKGMIADFAIHDKGDGNPHVHIMLTTRPILANGKWGVKERKGFALDENGERIPIIDPKTGEQKLGAKNSRQWKRETIQVNDWNQQANAEVWRKNWADECNQLLDKSNQIDHRSFERQGIELIPTIHEGYMARKIEKNGGISERCEMNRSINLENIPIQELNKRMSKIKKKYTLKKKNKSTLRVKMKSLEVDLAVANAAKREVEEDVVFDLFAFCDITEDEVNTQSSNEYSR